MKANLTIYVTMITNLLMLSQVRPIVAHCDWICLRSHYLLKYIHNQSYDCDWLIEVWYCLLTYLKMWTYYNLQCLVNFQLTTESIPDNEWLMLHYLSTVCLCTRYLSISNKLIVQSNTWLIA